MTRASAKSSTDRQETPPRAAAVLTKATLRAAALLDINDVHLGAIIGVSPSSVSRLHKARAIEPDTKEGQLAVLFLRLFRALDACFGGTEPCKRWLWAPNAHVRGTPAELIQSPEGLVNVIRYLDAVRGKL